MIFSLRAIDKKSDIFAHCKLTYADAYNLYKLN